MSAWTKDEAERLQELGLSPQRTSPEKVASLVEHFRENGSVFAVTEGDKGLHVSKGLARGLHVSKGLARKVRDLTSAGKLDWVSTRAADLPASSKATLEDTLRREDGVHQEGLRKLISHIADWIRDWSKPLPLVSPAGPTVMPYGPDAKPLMGWRNIEQDPVYQALSEHLEGTETWKDFTRYKELRRLYWKATLPHEFSGDPEWVHSQEEKLAELRKTRDAIWKELNEVEYEVSRGFRELLMLPRIPGKCRWCRRPHA